MKLCVVLSALAIFPLPVLAQDASAQWEKAPAIAPKSQEEEATSDERFREKFREWQSDPVIADEKGVCGPWSEASPETSFERLTDVKVWRERYRSNCWWLAFDGPSKYYIRTYDWGSVSKSSFSFGPGGVNFAPVDIWVQGVHENDRSVPYRRSLTLYRVTCVSSGAPRQAPMQFVAYDRNDKVIEQWERPEAAAKAALPGSKEEAFAWAICN
jgi:hypothetical protein